MRSVVLYLSFIVWVCTPSGAKGAKPEENSAHLDSVMQRIYNFNFSMNVQQLSSLELAYLYYWKGLSGEALDENLKLSQKQLKAFQSSQNAEQLAADFLEFRILVTQNKRVEAGLKINGLKSNFEKTQCDSTDDLIQLYWGIYHYFASYARSNHPLLKWSLALWPNSDKELGLFILTKLLNNKSIFIRTEAQYFLSRIYLEFENKPQKALDCLSKLHHYYPQNTVYTQMFLQAKSKVYN
jgi:hypothetical protein